MVTRHAQSASVSWTAPLTDGGTPVTDYRVEASTDGLTWGTVGDAVSTATTALVPGLDRGPAYVVRVAAVNGAGTGPWAAATAVTSWRTATPRATRV